MSSDEEYLEDESTGIDSEWSHEDDENNDAQRMLGNRSILWLCQEGQIQLARQRFQRLLEDGRTDSGSIELLRKEVFQMGRDKNYALHEVLMGGTSDENAYALCLAILDFSQNFPLERTKMLSCTPPSHRRTPLHWAAWGNASMEILRALVKGNPEALLMRDKPTQGGRTPIEIMRRYFAGHDGTNRNDARIQYLEVAMASWISHRVRLSVLLCTNRFFGRHSNRTVRTPFDKTDRRNANMKPRPWFALSVIGFLLQREMKPIAMKIISYVGGNAKIKAKRMRTIEPSRKRKR